MGVRRVAFAPLIRDQGNLKLGTGGVARAVVKGMPLAYDTEKRLQKQGVARDWTLQEWKVEAGPAYFGDTVIGVKRGDSEAASTAAARGSISYMRKR